MNVIKRDGRVVEFDAKKILAAIQKSFASVHPGHTGGFIAEKIVDEIVDIIGRGKGDATVEEIQDRVERCLMREWPTVAKAYILYREEHRKLRGLVPDNSALSDYIFTSKYAKYLPELKRRETWNETINRVENMHLDRFGHLCGAQIHEAFAFVRAKLVLPSMRSMQFAGDAIEKHNARMYNCSFTHIDRPEVFGQSLYLLLCGCGVGFSVQHEHVSQLPALAVERSTKTTLHYTIRDTIEGWADAVTVLVNSFVEGFGVEFIYRDIRPLGSPLSSGGKAPGHVPLKRALQAVESILEGAGGRKLRPIECYDIMCHLAEAVLSGGIRRSSLIALFSSDDDEMLMSKAFDNFNDNPHRAMANNSAVLLRDKTTFEEFKRIMDLNNKCFGEPGFYFSNDVNYGTNPCGEIGMAPIQGAFSFCNLTEINLAACPDRETFAQAAMYAAIIGTLQAAYNNIPYLGQKTEIEMDESPLLGVSITGIMDNLSLLDDEKFIAKVVSDMIRVNEHVSELIGIKAAKRMTCVKPSGTSSLVLGCVGSGIHPHHSSRYFRRVTANRHENVANYFRSINPHMVTDKPNGDVCITFPIQCGKDAITLEYSNEFVMIDTISKVYRSWVVPGSVKSAISGLTHNISATVVYDPNRWNELVKYVWDRRAEVCSMTFLPNITYSLPFMPRETVDQKNIAVWNSIIESYTKVDYSKLSEMENTVSRDVDAACSGGACELVHTNHDSSIGCDVVLMDDIEGINFGDNGVVEVVMNDGWTFKCRGLENGGTWLKVQRLSGTK